jgi:hypothetical protein
VFTVECSATEQISAEYMGYSWDPVTVQTPADFVSESSAPVVTTFVMPASLNRLTVMCKNAFGVAVPYANVYMRCSDPLRIDQQMADAGGTTMRMVEPGRQFEVWAVADGSVSATQLVQMDSDQQLELEISEAKVPPIARFEISPRDGLAPLTVGFDASTSSAGDGIASWEWLIERSGVTVVDSTESVPLLEDVVFDTPGHYRVTLRVYDVNGTSDREFGAVCVYGPQ